MPLHTDPIRPTTTAYAHSIFLLLLASNVDYVLSIATSSISSHIRIYVPITQHTKKKSVTYSVGVVIGGLYADGAHAINQYSGIFNSGVSLP